MHRRWTFFQRSDGRLRRSSAFSNLGLGKSYSCDRACCLQRVVGLAHKAVKAAESIEGGDRDQSRTAPDYRRTSPADKAHPPSFPRRLPPFSVIFIHIVTKCPHQASRIAPAENAIHARFDAIGDCQNAGSAPKTNDHAAMSLPQDLPFLVELGEIDRHLHCHHRYPLEIQRLPRSQIVQQGLSPPTQLLHSLMRASSAEAYYACLHRRSMFAIPATFKILSGAKIRCEILPRSSSITPQIGFQFCQELPS